MKQTTAGYRLFHNVRQPFGGMGKSPGYISQNGDDGEYI